MNSKLLLVFVVVGIIMTLAVTSHGQLFASDQNAGDDNTSSSSSTSSSSRGLFQTGNGFPTQQRGQSARTNWQSVWLPALSYAPWQFRAPDYWQGQSAGLSNGATSALYEPDVSLMRQVRAYKPRIMATARGFGKRSHQAITLADLMTSANPSAMATDHQVGNGVR